MSKPIVKNESLIRAADIAKVSRWRVETDPDTIIEIYEALKAAKGHIEIYEALKAAKGHLLQELENAATHPVGQCPVLGQVSRALARMRGENTAREHVAGRDCWCEPVQDGIVWIHNREQ
jgi:hypothetical protein